MGAYLGNTEVGQMFLGSTEIGQAYLGSTKVWEKGGVTPPQPVSYDSEIEFLYSDGTAYIDTGIEATGALSISIKYNQINTTNAAICGAIYKNGSSYIRHHLSAGLYYYAGSSILSFSADNAYHTLTIDADNGVAIFDGTSVNFTKASFTCNCNYGLFARPSVNMALQGKPSYIAWARLSTSGMIVRDFIPVRVGQVGYMYDKVSGQLFGNAGSGNFTLGNDITT